MQQQDDHRGDASGEKAGARAGAHESQGSKGGKDQGEAEQAHAACEEGRSEEEGPADSQVGGEVVLIVEDAGHGVGLRGGQRHQARVGHAKTDRVLEHGDAHDEGVGHEHRDAERAQAAAAQAGRRRRCDDGKHRRQNEQVAQAGGLVRRPDDGDGDPRHPERERQRRSPGSQRDRVAAQQD